MRHSKIKGYLEEFSRIFQILFSKLEYVLLVYEKENYFPEREVYYVTNAKNKSNILNAVSALPDNHPVSSFPVEIPNRN